MRWLMRESGGLDNQTLSAAGDEANLDVQFAYGISFPTPGTFWSTGGRPPFKADTGTPTDTNEPYTEVCPARVPPPCPHPLTRSRF